MAHFISPFLSVRSDFWIFWLICSYSKTCWNSITWLFKGLFSFWQVLPFFLFLECTFLSGAWLFRQFQGLLAPSERLYSLIMSALLPSFQENYFSSIHDLNIVFITLCSAVPYYIYISLEIIKCNWESSFCDIRLEFMHGNEMTFPGKIKELMYYI